MKPINKWLLRLVSLMMTFGLGGFIAAQIELPPTTTLPADQLPDWLDEDGIFMAHNMDPFIARVKIETGGYIPTEQMVRRFELEHSLEVIKRLKALGVTMTMPGAYKGAGMKAELPSMKFLKDYVELCHREGMRVAVYVYSGSLFSEIFAKERLDMRDWLTLDQNGQPQRFSDRAFRFYANRVHPDSQAHLKEIVAWVAREMKPDLLHFDNYMIGAPGNDKISLDLFRNYLREHGTPKEYGLADFNEIKSAPTQGGTPLYRAWLRFITQFQAGSLAEVVAVARAIDPKVLIDSHPGTAESGLGAGGGNPGSMLRYSEAYFSGDGSYSGRNLYSEGLVTAIRDFRTAQAMGNMLFTLGIHTPGQLAENMAFNTNGISCPVNFQDFNTYDPTFHVGGYHGTYHLDEVLPMYRFFREKRSYLSKVTRLPDIAVLRSFTSQVLVGGGQKATYLFEQHCIDARTPWTFVFEEYLDDLDRYPAVCLVGSNALTDQHIGKLRKYAKSGGGLILTDETGKFDEHANARPVNPFADLQGERIVRVKPDATFEEAYAAFKKACGGKLKLKVEGPDYLKAELVEQTDQRRRLVHLVNYDLYNPVVYPQVEARVPADWKVQRAVLLDPYKLEPRQIAFQQQDDRVLFTVPSLKAYAIISLETGESQAEP